MDPSWVLLSIKMDIMFIDSLHFHTQISDIKQVRAGDPMTLEFPLERALIWAPVSTISPGVTRAVCLQPILLYRSRAKYAHRAPGLREKWI